MNDTEKLRLVRLAYAGALADTVLQLGKEGALERVTERKRAEQLAAGRLRAKQFGIDSAGQVPGRIAELFDCAQWEVQANGRGFAAEARACLLCSLARKLGAPQPCRIYCLDPMEGLIKGLDPELSFTAHETLWEGSRCRIEAR